MEQIFEIDGRSYTLSYEDALSAELRKESEKDGVTCIRLSLRWGRAVTPSPVTITYRLPCTKMYTMWDPIEKRRHLGVRWNRSYGCTESRLAAGMPLKGVLSRRGLNTYLLALSDVKSPISIKMGASEQGGFEEVRIDLFTALTGPFSSYETVLRIDERRIPFDRAIASAVDWFASLGYVGERAPEAATAPMYSTWYAYLKSVSARAVLRECREAVKLGMRTVLVDDGWQTDVTEGAYAYCGDWEPSRKKFGDMRAFVDRVHALGMKVMLWFSVPFIGYRAKNHKTFEGRYLYDMEASNCSVLDPRYREVREFLVNTYVDAVKKWDLDGLKLDFIDRFKTNGTVTDEMDHVSVEDAVEALLREISTALRAVKPDILLEFRQPYFGPVVSTYGNILRVWDCPLDSVTNKTQTLNLRLVSRSCAVHADMMYWHETETPENVALQLYGTLFSVPQISTTADGITPLQREVLKRYLSFWNAHRETLLEGDLRVSFTENGYGYAESVRDGECIALVSAGGAVGLRSDVRTCYAVNLTGEDRLLLRVEGEGRVFYEILDCSGRRVTRRRLVRSRLSELEVPLGGMLVLTREN